MKSKLSLSCLLVAICTLFSGCDYDFPLTAKPTHKIDKRLLGDWAAAENKESRDEMMHVREFDDSHYAVSMDNDIYRAFHSDFAGTAFLSVQDLNAGNRKYLYFTWTLSDDGTQLSLKGVSTKTIPEATKNPAEMQRLIKQHLGNPNLFRDEVKFIRKESSH